MKFKVSDMTCSHCVKVISNAIVQRQKSAKVDIDLVTHTVSVSSDLKAQDIIDVIKKAGYSAQEIKEAETEAITTCCNPSHSCHA